MRSQRIRQIVIGGLILALSSATVHVHAADADKVDFNRQIRPLLSKYCLACHGQDENDREAGLRLDDRDSALAKLDSGEIAIVPKKPKKKRTLSEDFLQR